jgi:succinate-semialdehyde dehydrogenase/glutarate-semialdehyde dehydrogenase
MTSFTTTNPANGSTLASWTLHTPAQVDHILDRACASAVLWSRTPIAERCAGIRALAAALRTHAGELSASITAEMGKPIAESRAEVEKCVATCEWYAVHAESMLQPVAVDSDATSSWIEHQPLGAILLVMPWNFPLWQVVRQMVPTLLAGNVCVLKHAPNVWGTAEQITAVLADALLPEGVFTNVRLDVPATLDLVDDPRIAGVALTGSEAAGRAVGARAGAALKPAVLELGGSDPFVILADADLPLATSTALRSRFLNAGQSCIAAKRIIVVQEVADLVVATLQAAIASMRVGDPANPDTEIGPLARRDLVEMVERQVADSIGAGAVVAAGATLPDGPGFWCQPRLLVGAQPGMAVFDEEVFGPVMSVTVARDTHHAMEFARTTRFGLGASIWSQDQAAVELRHALHTGTIMLNGMVKSDVRFPFGGTRASGLGRELGLAGLTAFTNERTVWVR